MNILFWDNIPDKVLLLLIEETEKLIPKRVQRYIEVVKSLMGLYLITTVNNLEKYKIILV